MKALQKFIKRHNDRNAQYRSFGWATAADEDIGTKIPSLTDKEKATLIIDLCRDISPEAVHQDGERKPAAAQKELAFLRSVKADMESLGWDVSEANY